MSACILKLFGHFFKALAKKVVLFWFKHFKKWSTIPIACLITIHVWDWMKHIFKRILNLDVDLKKVDHVFLNIFAHVNKHFLLICRLLKKIKSVTLIEVKTEWFIPDHDLECSKEFCMWNAFSILISNSLHKVHVLLAT